MKLTLFYIGDIRVCVDPTVLLPVFLAFVTENGDLFIMAFISLVLHETAHTAVAYACSAHIAAIVIHPLGMRAELAERGKNAADEIMTAAAGPLFSLSAGMLAHAAADAEMFSSTLVEQFATVNFAIAIMNLLPAPPLDGAEILRSILSRKTSVRKAATTLFILGAAASGAFLYISIKRADTGEIPYAFACAALLFALEAVNTLRMANKAQAMQNKRSAVRRRGSMEVREIAVSAHMTVKEALKLASGAGYVRFVVLDDDMREMVTIGEGEVYGRVADAGGIDVTFLDIMCPKGKAK